MKYVADPGSLAKSIETHMLNFTKNLKHSHLAANANQIIYMNH
jgi:hypothetical protein